ncbi:MAG: outer membrane beta-barrel protein [Planctomycetota bacterium]
MTLAFAPIPILPAPQLDTLTERDISLTAPAFVATQDEIEYDDRFYDNRREGTYLQIGIGLATTSTSDGPGEEVDFDEGYAIPIALGWRMNGDDGDRFVFDAEIEAYWSDQDADESNEIADVSVLGGFLNGVGDWMFNDWFSGYAGAGVGITWVDASETDDGLGSFDDSDGPLFSWQLKAGLRWYVTEESSWSLGYRFVNIDDAEIDDDIDNVSFDLETEQHVVEVGYRFML